ncbi:putative selenium delivery protein YdfZ [Celerinatantimonas yamalensis]|uniref:Selenium delivery protein YdfZ n=1 Tax=Celerinatantimonas yamalensis TaxID=559956 RepID=A0ABW9G7X2_9GAMM
MSKVYDLNHNELTVGQRVLIKPSGETSQIEQIHAENLSAYAAEHNRCIQLKQGQFAPIDLVRLG